ncbi:MULTISPECIES: hypothetical protein [unclassified Acinetobacter]|uniref:hypothetical protein n=1 Tax=unclassified Acinetobacter TaxID=196816 RepID=UPI001C54FE17|nr:MULTISPECIES: hypothetical protein [unclassified Acinetobacter]
MKSINLKAFGVVIATGFISSVSWANPTVSTTTEQTPVTVTTTTENVPVVPKVEVVKPFTKAEVQQGMLEMQQRQNQRIEEWGKTLKADDFERSWYGGRQLKKAKRQEVCGLYQGLVNETYSLAQKNKARLSVADQQLVADRNQFIQSLGYEKNIVDTKMGFNCRLK